MTFEEGPTKAERAAAQRITLQEEVMTGFKNLWEDWGDWEDRKRVGHDCNGELIFWMC